MNKQLEVHCSYMDPATSEEAGQSYKVWDVYEAAALVLRMSPQMWEVRVDGEVSDYMENCVEILVKHMRRARKEIRQGAAFSVYARRRMQRTTIHTRI